MALPHARSGQRIALQPFGAALPQQQSCALLKGRQLELMRLVLPAGKAMPAHSVPGELTLLCLEGEVELQAHGQSQRLGAGELVWLEGGVEHALLARRDSSLLLTIQLSPPT